MNEEVRHFSLRKLSVGLASVLVGVSIFGTSQTVKADTVANNQTSSVTSNAQSNDTQKNENVAKSSFSNDNQANNAKSNLIQTQVEGKNEQKQVQTENGQQDSVSKTQEATDSNDLQQKDAEKGVVRTSSLQEPDNQSNNHAEDNSQTQNEQKLDLTKNSKKLDEKALATNLTQDDSSQKDYTPDISAWTGHNDGTYYILDKYTPQNNTEKDLIVIPNEADFEKAGKSTNGHEVGIKSDAIHTAMKTYNPKEIHFSETDNKKIKAIDPDWHSVFRVADDSGANYTLSHLEAITGNSLDTKNINDMRWLCYNDEKLTNISALSTWDVSNVSNMTAIFQNTDISDLTPLTNWNTKSLFYIGHGFSYLPHLTSIEPLQKWNMQNTRLTDNMFTQDPELVNINAINNWDYSNEIAAGGVWGNYPLDDMFYGDHKIQINIGTDSGLADFIRRTGRIDAFHNSSNQITTSNTKLIELLTNTDFKVQNETTTAKRTITFTGLPANRAIPPIVQTINYTKLATAVIDMTGTSDSNAHGKIVSSGFEKDWKLDTSKQNDDVIINGVICFKPVKMPHINGYKAHLVRNKINPAMLMVSFMAVPTENKPSKPSAHTDKPNNSAWSDLDHKVVDGLNADDSGWTMPENTSTYTVEVPADDATIDLSDLVIAEPIHAHTHTQIRVTKRFKLSKKHSIKHLKHRKKAVRQFKKYRL